MKETNIINNYSPTATWISGIDMRKMYFTSKKSFLIEQNADGTLLITKTSTMKPLENAGGFIVSQGGIEAILAKCVEVTEEQFAEDRKQLLLRHEQAKQHSLGIAMAKRWKLPLMTIGYSCHQYDCDGKTATTIKIDRPIEYRGEKVAQFHYGAPSGHLRDYCRI